MKIAIDTNIMINAFQNNDIDALTFLLNFLSNLDHQLAVDYEGIIIKEYSSNLANNELYNKFYVRLTGNSDRLFFISCKYDNKHKNGLLLLGFNGKEDHAFTGVAYNCDKIIVTEDSDFGKGPNPKANESDKQAVLMYMTNLMGLMIYDSKEAKEAI